MLKKNYDPFRPPMLFINFEPFPVIYNGEIYWAKVIEAKRLDAYRGV
jgi:hypothetical protein